MQLDTSLGVYTAQDLIAYMSASDVIKGQGGPARATLFMQLLAPRFTLLPVRSAFLTANMQLFALSAADLPAVGPIEHAEVSHNQCATLFAHSAGMWVAYHSDSRIQKKTVSCQQTASVPFGMPVE